MAYVPPARHLLRAKDLADARYSEPLGVDDLAAAAGLSKAHFSRELRRAFGESPHAYTTKRRRLPSTPRRSAWRCVPTLMAIPGAPVMDEETGNQVRELMAKGFAARVSATPPATASVSPR